MRHWYLICIIVLLSTSCAFAVDGEGSARLLSPETLTAGVPVRLEFEFTVGPGGIPVGGGISLGLHHAAEWGAIQVDNPKGAGYATVIGPVEDNFDLAWHEWAPKTMFPDAMPSGKSDHIHHQVLVATVKGNPLNTGDTVCFTLGANHHQIKAPRSVDPDHRFQFTTDTDGDGVYKGITRQIEIPILPGPAHHLVAVVPSMLQTGTRVEILVRAEDEQYNLATTCNAPVTVRDEQGTILLRHIPLQNGLLRATITTPAPGPHRLRLKSGDLEGRSNPCKVFATLPKHRIFWGDIHGHTSISDGLGADASEYYSFARDVAGLDVCALTDHGHFDWPQTMAAAKAFHDPGNFITILAQEAGAGPDHMNLYYRSDDTEHIDGWAQQYDQFYDMIYRQYNAGDTPRAITAPHHFTYPRGDDRYPFGLFDTRTARFVEVYSSHGTSEYLGNPRPCAGAKDEKKFMQWGLAQGLRFGVIGSSDNHDSHPGRSIWAHYPGGLVAFLAPALTRDAIWDALWNYRVYATSFDRIYMEFTINDQIMGSDLKADSCKIAYTIIGKTDTLEAILIRDNKELRRDKTNKGVVEIRLDDTPAPGEHFYYLRIEQDNGERAWSTPIWVTKE